MYRGIVQPKRQATLSRQISVIDTSSVFCRQNTYELSSINAQWKAKRLNSVASTCSASSCSSCSSCETDMTDVPKRKRVTFSLNPSLTIHEHSDTIDDVDHVDHVEELVITNRRIGSEVEAENSNNTLSNT